MDDLARLAASKYLSLTTYRKSGEPVATPVWLVRDGEHLYVTTGADSGKVKRLRNNSEVLLAPCDVRGNVTGAHVPGTATLLDEQGSTRVASLIAKRYGLMARMLSLVAKLRGSGASIGIEISVTPN